MPVFYRKYRPKTFSEVVGQEHVVQTLQGALRTGTLAHAYLFTGPRGTGKTTIARLLAKAVNCDRNVLRSTLSFSINSGNEILSEAPRSDACGICDFCKEIEAGKSLDLMEIDAASNRGIDEIRELREGTRFASARGKHKVYIIDECHMLTKEAFNAFLKTLEEPPPKTLFVLATTEPNKVLSTVASRTQRFDLKKLKPHQITAKLEHIAGVENIKIEKNLLNSIALQADGSLRDAESCLSKLVAFRGHNIDEKAIKEVLGFIPLENFHNFIAFLIAKDRAQAISMVNNLYESGVDLSNFTKELLAYLRKVLIAKASPATLASYYGGSNEELAQKISILASNIENQKLLEMLGLFFKAQQEMKISPIPQLPLEIAIIELTN